MSKLSSNLSGGGGTGISHTMGGRPLNNMMKPQSLAFNGKLSDFDNPLVSNTVDLTKNSQ